ncbi:tetratricopeptide repeat protein [Nodosilinea sp. P-1105]|uniref:tetratricopeptide repeat protein n=1 Tax=Nodosilinea sp. P-1105 TaxID=2546229 RepID=UPI00146BDA58|nr:tetratricopeptide repeat protein [Nodosilinea sp. P-1105]NMF81946.1 tetratricopeptide repeat protein [Nodosilinea sp. P-1105]
MTKDFFISYNSADATWAEWMAWVLEEHGYTVTIQAWDFRPGGNFILDMQRAAAESQRTIAVLSDDYLTAIYTQSEWAAAFKQDPTSRDRKLLPIRVAPCQPTGMLAPLVYVDLVGQSEAEAETLLIEALKDRVKPETRPSFPQAVPQSERVTVATVTFPGTPQTLPLNNLQDRGIDPQRFVGRQADLNHLHACLDNHRKVVIVGMFGLGKTELAIQYARTYTADYPGGVAWFAADHFATDLSHWIQVELFPDRDLRHLDLAQQVTVAWEEWHNFCAQRPALVIVDDVTDYGQQVAPYLPPNEDTAAPFRFVFTSRSHISTIQTFDLPQLSLPDALHLLERLAGTARIQADAATAEAVCKQLGALPLALTLMGSWLNIDPDRTVADLSRALDQQGLDAPALDCDPDTVLTAKRGVKAAFAVSWAQLNQRSADAAQLARVLTLFAPVDLPWTLIETVIETYTQEYGLSAPSTPSVQPEPSRWKKLWQTLWRWLRQLWGKRTPPARSAPPPVYPVNAPLEARGHLLRLNLLECVRQESAEPEPPQTATDGILPAVASPVNSQGWGVSAGYRLHPLLRDLFAEQWPGFDRDHWALAFALGIAAEAEQVPKQVEAETASQFAPLKAHFARAESILKRQQQATAVTMPSVAERYKVANNKISAADFRLSHRVMFALRFEQAQKIYDEAKAAAAAGQQSLASHKFAEAIEYYQKVVDDARLALPPHSVPLAGYLNRLARIFRDLGQYSRGISLAEEAVDIAEIRQIRPAKLASYLIDLAELYYKQGHYTDAEPLLQQALAMRQRLLGDEHPDVATSLNNLAGLYDKQGRYTDAEPLFQDALAMYKRLLGDEHPDVATSLNNLAGLYDKQGRYTDAEPLFQDALAMRQRLLGDEHPDVATSLNNLASLYDKQGRHGEAKSLFQQALAILEAKLGADHPWTVGCRENLAKVENGE